MRIGMWSLFTHTETRFHKWHNTDGRHVQFAMEYTTQYYAKRGQYHQQLLQRKCDAVNTVAWYARCILFKTAAISRSNSVQYIRKSAVNYHTTKHISDNKNTHFTA